MSRRKFLMNLGGLTGMASTPVIAAELSSHFDLLDIKQYDLATPKVPENFDLVIAFITDLHVGCPSVPLDKIPDIVDQVNHLTFTGDDGQKMPVDLIGIGGDILINKHYDPRAEFVYPQKIVPLLGGLKAPLGVYTILGNHDWDFMQYVMHESCYSLDKNIWDMFADNNIQLLENEKIALRKNGMEFDLVGLPDYKTRWEFHFDPDIFQDMDKRPAIVLSHDPKSFEQVPSGIVAQLSGHTHGGQYTVPIIHTPLYLPTKNTPSHYAYGHVRENGRDMYVSSGIGTSTVSLKNTPNEVVLLRVHHGMPVA